MTMSPDRRKRACMYHIESRLNTDKTVEWMLKEFANDEAVKRAKYPEKLCRNIITMGAQGRERFMNQQAHAAALFEIMERERDTTRKQLDELRIRESELRSEVQDLKDTINDLEAEKYKARILELEEGEAA